MRLSHLLQKNCHRNGGKNSHTRKNRADSKKWYKNFVEETSNYPPSISLTRLNQLGELQRLVYLSGCPSASVLISGRVEKATPLRMEGAILRFFPSVKYVSTKLIDGATESDLWDLVIRCQRSPSMLQWPETRHEHNKYNDNYRSSIIIFFFLFFFFKWLLLLLCVIYGRCSIHPDPRGSI